MIFEKNGSDRCEGFIFTRYITRNGRRIYHPNGGVFKIPMSKLKNRRRKNKK